MSFELNENPKGYWGGMPPQLKSRVYFFAIYYMATGYFASMGAWWGYVLFLLPSAWWFLKNWFFSEFLGLWDKGEQGLFGYTFDYVWNANVYVRSFAFVTVLAAVLGGLGWLGTEDLREERAKPSLIERTGALAEKTAEKAGKLATNTGDKVGEITVATKEKTGNWFERAKGWFDRD